MAVERLIVDFGGTRIALKSPDRVFLNQAAERYSAFLCSGDSFAFEVLHHPDESVFRQKWGWLSHLQPERRRILIGSDPDRGVEVADGALRMLLPGLVSPDLIVHGAMLDFSGEAVFCCGKPGSGKSTMAGLFPDEACCDELCRLHQEGEILEGRSLPFWEARPKQLPLARIFILEHGAENHLCSLEIPEAMREMQRHVYWPPENFPACHTVFENVAKLVSRIPVFRLAFRPDLSVREFLENPIGKLEPRDGRSAP